MSPHSVDERRQDRGPEARRTVSYDTRGPGVIDDRKDDRQQDRGRASRKDREAEASRAEIRATLETLHEAVVGLHAGAAETLAAIERHVEERAAADVALGKRLDVLLAILQRGQLIP